jgi:hypothetical protein
MYTAAMPHALSTIRERLVVTAQDFATRPLGQAALVEQDRRAAS